MKKEYIKTDLIKQYLKDNNLSKTAFCKNVKFPQQLSKRLLSKIWM